MEKIINLLKDKEYIKHLITYVFFGILTTIVSLGSFWFLRNYVSFIEENIANAISIILGIVFAYFTNRTYVFHSKETNRWKEFFQFAMSRAFTFCFDMICFFIFATLLGFHEMLVKIVIAFAVVILNYIFSKVFVFRDRKEKKNG